MVRSIVLAALAALIALPAAAVVKVYDSTPPNGIAGSEFQFSTTLCPPIQESPGQMQGSHKLDDTGSGTVTLVEMNIRRIVDVNFGTDALTVVFGPGR